MKLELNEKRVLFVHFNGRSEIHGTDRESAGDIKIKATLPNTILRQFHGTLMAALYFHDTENPGNDLADKAMEDNPDHLPHRRFPHLAMPLKWSDSMEGGELIIHHGAISKATLTLKDIVAHKFEIVAKDGGTVELTFVVKCKPTPLQAGELYSMIQQEVEITLKAPKAEADLVDNAAGAAVVTS